MRRIVICTTYPAAAEPRAPKVAARLARDFPATEVVLVDTCPEGATLPQPTILNGIPNLRRRTATLATRASSPLRWLAAKGDAAAARRIAPRTRFRFPVWTTAHAHALWRELKALPADVYVGHNFDTLPLVCAAGRMRGARVIFDSMEFHSDMGMGQSEAERDLVRRQETLFLRQCDLILASSDPIAEALQRAYGVERVVPIYNTPPLVADDQLRAGLPGFPLYWRNAVVDIGQRGAEDILAAMRSLPDDVVLYVQGRVGPGDRLAKLAERLGLRSRLVFCPPFSPEQAVTVASGHLVGLCPERDTCTNQRLTVSNKIFDYMMAGLAVIGSDLPGIGSVIRRASAGRTYPSGKIEALAESIRFFYDNPDQLHMCRANARAFARATGNEAVDMSRLSGAFADMIATA
jgi:glycosyltransferase involved in cell wall biosynthesis